MEFMLEGVKASSLNDSFNDFDANFGKLFSFLSEDPRLDKAVEGFEVVIDAEGFVEEYLWFLQKMINKRLDSDWYVWRVRDAKLCKETNTIKLVFSSVGLVEGLEVY